MSLQGMLFPGRRRRVPTFDKTASALSPATAHLYRALEVGAEFSRSYFENIGQRPEPHLREMLVRYHARLYLEAHALSVESEELVAGNEPMAALVLRVGPVEIRTLKSQGGQIPGCGQSVPRRDAYNQRRGFYVIQNVAREIKLHLVCLWEYDRNFNVGGVWLACPTAAAEQSADVICEWLEPLPHPADLEIIGQGPREDSSTEQEFEQLLRENEEEESEEQEPEGA